jgi:glucokinase
MSELRKFLVRGDALRPLYLGVDLGGTNIKVGAVDAAGGVLSWISVPTHAEEGPAAGAVRIGQAVQQAIAAAGLEPQDLHAVGLASTGAVDAAGGTLVYPVNLPDWHAFPLCATVSQLCGLPVRLFNDAAAAAYGEFWVGTAQPFASMVLLTLGTGVGSGVVVGGRVMDGDHGLGTELGHTVIDYNADAHLCTCGQRGHLEAYAGALSVVRRAKEALAASRPTSLSERLSTQPAGGKASALTAKLVAAEAEAGDEVCREIVFETARFLGIGIVNILHTVDPGIVVLGGAMNFGGETSPLGREFIERIREEVRRRALPAVDKTPIEFASLGGDAGFIGAAAMARLADEGR